MSVDDNNILNKTAGQDPSRQPKRSDVFHCSLLAANKQELRPIDTWTGKPIYPHPKPVNPSETVIEERDSECEESDQRLLHLTPDLARQFPDTQSIYNYLSK